MVDLFDNGADGTAGTEGGGNSAPRPLADRLRPQTLAEVIGQRQVIGPDAPLTVMLESGSLSSLIFWGPPGTGKTTMARLLAHETNLHFVQISAIFSGVADLKKVFETAKQHRRMGQGTLLFVDEIHRFNKAQQDSFLPHMEDGTILLVGATTENPSFELNAALLSRSQVLVLERLSMEDLEQMAQRAEEALGRKLPLTAEAREALLAMADGDGRAFLNLVEQAAAWKTKEPLTPEQLSARLMRRAAKYDKSGDEHYNLISALHKSVRGSDPDAALYWFCRMLEGARIRAIWRGGSPACRSRTSAWRTRRRRPSAWTLGRSTNAWAAPRGNRPWPMRSFTSPWRPNRTRPRWPISPPVPRPARRAA